MIKEIRFKGTSPQGKLVTGTFSAMSQKEIKEHLTKLSSKYQLKILSVESKKRLYL